MLHLLRTFPAPTGAVLSAVAAAVLMIHNAATGQATFDEAVFSTAIAAVWLWWTGRTVTPLVRPRDAEGRPLRPAEQPPAGRGHL